MLKLLLILPVITLIHSWYPRECCSDRDCFPVYCEDIIEKENGSVSYGEVDFSKDKIKLSQDKFCHVCISNKVLPLCVFIQTNS